MTNPYSPTSGRCLLLSKRTSFSRSGFPFLQVPAPNKVITDHFVRFNISPKIWPKQKMVIILSLSLFCHCHCRCIICNVVKCAKQTAHCFLFDLACAKITRFLHICLLSFPPCNFSNHDMTNSSCRIKKTFSSKIHNNN